MADDGSVATFGSAARSFAALVHDIPGDRWDGPGLGKWDLRSLVGHTSRSIITVSTYLQHSAGHEDLSTAQDYYVHIRGSALGGGSRPPSSNAAGRPAGISATIPPRPSTVSSSECAASWPGPTTD